MNAPECYYDRLFEMDWSLKAIEDDKQAETTLIRGEEFDNQEWLEAERAELKEKQDDMEATVTISGEFVGLES